MNDRLGEGVISWETSESPLRRPVVDTFHQGTVEAAHSHVDRADAVLVVGTSLEVFSAYRF
eukprot:1195272-Prorocentrum_minimum.AAC.1